MLKERLFVKYLSKFEQNTAKSPRQCPFKFNYTNEHKNEYKSHDFCTLLSPRLCAFRFLHVVASNPTGLSPSPRTFLSNSSNLYALKNQVTRGE